MTFEELKEKYPIGMKIGLTFKECVSVEYYYNDNDLLLYRNKPNVISVETTNVDNVCLVISKVPTYDYQVDGYLYDGKWHLVQDSWDRYIPINLEE